MSDLLLSSVIGTAAGIIGTGIGGAVGFFLKNPSRRFLSTLLSFSSGLMISVVCFDLLPEAFEMGGVKAGILGIIIGYKYCFFSKKRKWFFKNRNFVGGRYCPP